MPAYPKLIIYYFSGTGNSANVARWISDAGLEIGMQTDVVNIAHIKRLNIPVPDDDALIAFCSPVHGFNYPPVMQSFIRRLPKGKNPVLLLNTRAGMLIGRWITPGLSGITFYLSALILKLKGYRIQAMFPVDLPSNWISVHPGLNRRTVEYLHIRNRERVEAFAQKVLNGQTDFMSVREIIQDIIISPVSLAYLFAGRFFFAKTYFASAACTRCNACIEQCPVKAIKSVANRPFWTFKCESCMHCMSYCPHKAIETAHGSILMFALIFSSIIWATVIQPAGAALHLNNALISFGIQTALMIFLLGVWYRIIHFLLRYKWVERIITYTSLTRYKFWGKRYKALKNNS